MILNCPTTLTFLIQLGLKKKDICLPFSDRPKILEKKGWLFFSFLIMG